MNVGVKYLFDTVYDPSYNERFCNFHYLPNNTPFIHALGDYKKNGWVCDQLANRLRMDYPEFYDRIINLFEPSNKGLMENNAMEEFEDTITEGSSISAKYSAKSDREKFFRTERIMLSICEKDHISLNTIEFTIFQFKDCLNKKLTNLSSAALLNDVFEFEKEKLKLIQSFLSDDIMLKNENKAIDNANYVFNSNSWKKKLELKLSPYSMCIESEWDWAQNTVLFTRFKVNFVEKNFHLAPHYYQTILLLDKHHVEVIEHLLYPIETYLLSILSKEEFKSISEVMEKMISFFENLKEVEILVYLEEAIRFLAYSGVVVVEEVD